MKKDRSFYTRLAVITSVIILLCAVLFIFVTSINGAKVSQQEKELEQLELSVRRAAAAYYAAEGFYPSTLDELIKTSGIQIDTRRFNVFYEVFAENLMPQITVVPSK